MLCLFARPDLYAQEYSLRGIISEVNSGQPLESATVIVQSIPEGFLKGKPADVNGFYQINGIPEGTYLFKVSFIGYRTYTDTLTIGGWDKDLKKNAVLQPADEELGDVEVKYKRRDEDLEGGQQKIRVSDLERVPTPAGSGDLASYLQTLPGVVSTGDRGGQLYVRGGTPSENMVLIDGSVIYQPFHIIGFFSVFPEEVISNADFYASGFGPEYSGRTSSVLDVKLRNGSYTDNRLSASLSPFVSELFYEGPIKENESSVMALFRGSVIEESSGYYPMARQPLKFNSQLVKFSDRNDKGANCSALFMRTYDRGKMDYEQGDVFRWRNFVLGGRCAALSQEDAVSFFEINVGISHTSNEVGRAGDPQRSSSITRFNTDFSLVQYAGKLRLDYGAFSNIRWLNYDISDLFLNTEQDRTVFITSGGFFKAAIPIGKKLEIKPGISASYYMDTFKPSFEPRFQLSWHPREKKSEELNLAAGLYRQPVAGISDQRDAGSAFTAWMPVPNSDSQTTSVHASAGWRQPLGAYVDVSVEGYYKWLYDLPVAVWSSLAEFSTELELADGTTRGADVSATLNGKNLFLKAAYGYSITEYTTAQDHFSLWLGEPVVNYSPAHDRRHQVNIQFSYTLNKTVMNLSWTYGSGLPYTRPYGFDAFSRYHERVPEVENEYGEPRVILDRPFNGRLPQHHLLNASVERAFKWQKTLLNLQAGAINAYDRQNLFYYDIYTQRKINQLPFFPYVSLKVETL